MNEKIIRYLREQHPPPESCIGAFMHDDKLICAQDGLGCVSDDCGPNTCMFYGVSTVPVEGWTAEEA